VGYTKIQVSSLEIAAVQFEKVGGGTLGLDAITVEGLKTGDTLRFWNGKIYDSVIWYGADAYGGVYDYEENCLGPGFGDSEQIISQKPLFRSIAFWVNSSSSATMTIAGQVGSISQLDDGEVNFGSGLTLINNTFPQEVLLSEITASGLATGDTLRFWNGKTYDSVIWYGADAYGGVYDLDENCLGPGFGDSEQIVSEDPILVGYGFWVSTAGSGGTITFPVPNLD